METEFVPELGTLLATRRPRCADEPQIWLAHLAAAEGENWVWKGADCLPPDYRRCVVSLSRGGADATVVREFDLQVRPRVSTHQMLQMAPGLIIAQHAGGAALEHAAAVELAGAEARKRGAARAMRRVPSPRPTPRPRTRH